MIRRVVAATITDQAPQLGMLGALRGIFGDSNVLELDFMHEASRMPLERVGTWFASKCLSFKPDWLFLQAQDTAIVSADCLRTLRSRLPGCVLSHWMGDAREHVSQYLSEICAATHLTLISSVGQIPMFKRAGAENVQYMQVGYDLPEPSSDVLDKGPPFRVPDVVFCGNYLNESFPGSTERIGAIRWLSQEGIDVGVVGAGWPGHFPVAGRCSVGQQSEIYRRAKVVLSINHLNDIDRYYSNRQIIAMASGTPVVCRYVPGIQHEFQHGRHLFWYETRDELIRYVRLLLDRQDIRKDMGRAARAEILKNHTWFSRFLTVLPIIERLQSRLQSSL